MKVLVKHGEVKETVHETEGNLTVNITVNCPELIKIKDWANVVEIHTDDD